MTTHTRPKLLSIASKEEEETACSTKGKLTTEIMMKKLKEEEIKMETTQFQPQLLLFG